MIIGWTATHNSNFYSIRWLYFWDRYLPAFTLIISYKSLQMSNCHRVLFHFQMNAMGFALAFLWAYTSANSRSAEVLLILCSFKELPNLYSLDKIGDRYTYRTTFHASWFSTIKHRCASCIANSAVSPRLTSSSRTFPR